jgi:predicted nucleic acid-binding protein
LETFIIRAALRAGADRLVSEDLQHGRRFGTLTIENPFAKN